MLISAAVLTIFVYGLLSPILGVLLPNYHLSPGQQSSLAMAQALGLMIASFSAGPVIDMKGNKVTMLVGLGLATVALVGAPNAGSYDRLLLNYFVLGAGGGIVITSVNSLASKIDPARRGSTLNFLNLFFGVGGVITTYVSSENVAPTTLCYSIAALAVLALLVDTGTKMPMPSNKAKFHWNEIPALLSQPALLLLSLFAFLYVACEVGVWNWLKMYLITRSFDPPTAGRVVAYGFAFGILAGRTVASRLLIRVSALTVTLAAAILMTITTYAMLSFHSTTAITAAVFCAGLSMAPVFPTTLAVVSDTFPRGTATALGIVITCGWLGLAVCSPIIGLLAQGNQYHRALLLLPLLSAAMIGVNLVLRNSVHRPVTV